LDVLVVNAAEASVVAGRSGSPAELAAALAELGPEAVIVTLGAEGALLVRHGDLTAIPAHAVDAVDTTAAGDAFVGAVAAALAAGEDVLAGCRRGAAAGALAATHAGAQPSLPTAAELERFLSSSADQD
jgi:ribokinase